WASPAPSCPCPGRRSSRATAVLSEMPTSIRRRRATTAFRIDPGTGAGAPPIRHDREATIVVVGCGGTGGFLAEAIARLLIGRSALLYLVDPDRVEPHNVARQCFDRADVGRFKAEVLAERLARRFGREVGYSVLPYPGE